jgi:hypothetical protein
MRFTKGFLLFEPKYYEYFMCPCVPYNLKGKGKVDPVLFLTEHHATKSYWDSGGIVPYIL